MKSNIVLIGMPGASKTTSGRGLSRALSRRFMDTDAIIEYEFSMPVSELISACGEDYFRRQETSVVGRLEDMENLVVAVGGGAVLSEENRRILSENAFCIWLKAKPLTLYDRLFGDENQRPILGELSIKKISSTLKKREKFYKEIADAELETDALSVERTVEKLKEIVSALERAVCPTAF